MRTKSAVIISVALLRILFIRATHSIWLFVLSGSVRYIRLTYLVPELLGFVDKGRMKMQPAVELFYLDEEAKGILWTL